MIVDLPQAIFEPADHGFRPVKFQFGKTVPHAGEGHLQRRGHGVVGEAGEKFKRVFLMDVVTGILGVEIIGLAFARPHGAGIVIGERHAQIERGGPELVVF